MPSSLKGKSDSHLRLVSDEEAVVIPEDARPTDETPTVISKNPPIVGSSQDKIVDLNRKVPTPESILAGLRGRRLAHFELIAPIGVGGMAAVIRARDTQLDRYVALKILPPEMSKEAENVQRFHQEAKAAAKLDHANIARVFFCGEDQGLHFIAFEFVEGMNLRTLMEQRGQIPVAESIRYILQIAAGLEHAASRGVVHRDVKPSNIIITPHGQAKLVDMGLARNLERKERDLTQSGMTLGTFDYISPEQALEPREADSRSDIYSLGCTLYHMLTGIPPVPEGTPLKKLDHHKHHDPVDPRQFNPDIPDEIVMILGKMMAKNPGDRYQRPIHLVQHLMQVAQKVGAANDVPEGVLFLDAPLPGQPRSRPVLMIGLALAALVMVVLMFSLAPDQRPILPNLPTPNPPVPSTNDKGGSQAIAAPGNGGGKLPETPVGLAPSTVVNAASLKAVLSDRITPTIKSKLTDPVDLAKDGLAFQGGRDQQLALDSDDPDEAYVKFQYAKGGSPFGIVLDSGRDVHFKRIKFLIDADSTPDRAAAALAVRGVRNVTFEQCMFIQGAKVGKISSLPKKVPLASVLIEATDDVRPTVHFLRCYFDGANQNGGQVAIAINGAANVKVEDCAFRPHAAFVSFRDKCSLAATALDMQYCAGFVEAGPAFRFGKDASVQLSVRNTLLARPGGGSPDRELAGLMFQAGDSAVRYQGYQNRYYNLDSLLQVKNRPPITRAEEFQSHLRAHQNEDVGSEFLDLAVNPLQHSNALNLIDNPLAFQVKEKYKNLGLRTAWTGEPMPAPPVAVVKATKKIVDPDDGGKTLGVFSTINAAMADAKDGDVIYLKHSENRRFIAPAVPLKPGLTVTIKPLDDKTRATLVLEQDSLETKSSLFKMAQKGKLQIEDIDCVLDPEKEFDRRSVVQLAEAAHLIFVRCNFTLRATNKVELSVVSFPDLDGRMKMDMASSGQAKVEFRDCFIRGKGDIVALDGCRKLDVDVTNSLVVLDGSLLDITAAGKASASDLVRWTMSRSSIFTTESLFALRSKSGMVLTKSQAKIKDCLLASLGPPGQPVVLLEMPTSDTLMPEKFLQWDGEQNYYANFDKAKVSEWTRDFPETRSDSGKISFSPKLAEESRRFWDATPDLFKPADPEQERLISGFGLPADSRLLQPPASKTDEP